MSFSLSAETIAEIRFATNYDSYERVLLKIDSPHFRGLGHDHTKVFVRHATDYCDRIALNYFNEVAYVQFLMTYLGSYFYEDFRYHRISAILHEVPEAFDDRIDRARSAFVTLGDRFIGKNLSLYVTDLKSFSGSMPSDGYEGNPDDVLNSLIACHGQRSYGLEPAQRYAFHQEAQKAVQHLGLLDLTGHNVCLALGYWLGFGFYKDPLFPWVRDKAREGGTSTLFAYAQQRLGVQFRMLGNLNG